MMEINKLFKNIDILKIIKRISLLILIIIITIYIPFIKNFLISFEGNSLFKMFSAYKKEKDLIFYLLNIIILITIYEMFVRGENKKQNQNKFLIKKLAIIDRKLDEIYILLNVKLDQEKQKKVRIAMKKIAYIINTLVNLLKESKLKELKVDLDKFKDQFDEFNQEFQDCLLEGESLENIKFQRKISVLENECLKIESRIL